MTTVCRVRYTKPSRPEKKEISFAFPLNIDFNLIS